MASVRFSPEIRAKHDENDMPPEVFDAPKKFVHWRRTVGQGK